MTESMEKRVVRWADHIPTLLAVGGVLAASILGYVKRGWDVDDLKSEATKREAGSLQRQKDHVLEMAVLNHRLDVLETINHCREIGGCK